MKPEKAGTPSIPRADVLKLLAVSFLLLFFELALIRWISSSIRIVAYFSNIVMIACFLGFGVGCILKRRRDLFGWFPWIALAIILLCRYLAEAGVRNPDESVEFVFGSGGRHNWVAVVPGVFALVAATFVCIGQRLAVLLDRFTPLKGYSLNVLGSLLGTLGFAIASFFSAGPLVWMVVCYLLAAALLMERKSSLAVAAVAMVLGGYVAWEQGRLSIWSPYSKIQLGTAPTPGRGFYLYSNDDYHQLALPLSGEEATKDKELMEWRLVYDLPYRLLGRAPERVLVLGAGTGNDVAAALRNGAGHVDAVELDPVIYGLGRSMHPDRPYQDPRVEAHLNDARYFLRAGEGRFDIIVLGWLDSHRLFSSLSNIRQDNFVYTVESMRQARRLLKDDGILCLSFFVAKDWLGQKIFGMLTEALGHAPEVFVHPGGRYGRQGHMFVIRADPTLPRPGEAPPFVRLTGEYETAQLAPYPTDDWPYLYYKERRLSQEYGWTLLVLIALSAAMVFIAVPKGRVVFSEAVQFFLLGAGFLLLETKNITSLALVYGSTWMVTSIVIMTVLIMILVANYFVERRGALLGDKAAWGLLLGSIVLALVWREEMLPFGGPAVRGLITTGVVSLTFLFAGVVFARAFARARVPSLALGFNVLGSVVGGLTEYLSLFVGIRGLLVIAAILYAAAWWASRRNASALAG